MEIDTPVRRRKLLTELQKGEFWHCTTPPSFESSFRDAKIRPNEGKNRFDARLSAAQYMKAVSLFDWAAPDWEKVQDRSDMWGFFRLTPLSLAIGINPARLQGEIIRYPDTRDRTSEEETGQDICGPFPYVELFHCGPILWSAVTRVIVICPRDLDYFAECSANDLPLIRKEVGRMCKFR